MRYIFSPLPFNFYRIMLTNNKEIYLISANTLRDKSLINKNVEDCYILTAIKAAQDIHLVEILGLPLVKKLCTLVETGNVSGEYKTLLDFYVSDYLTFKVMSEIQIPLWSKMRQEGIVNATGTEYQNVTKNECTYTKEYYDDIANGLSIRMISFLDSSSIKEWKDRCSCRKTSYTTHICLA